MTDPIEQSVREALSTRAARLDTSAIDRLSAIDYKPRRSRLVKPAIGGGLGVAGIAGAVVATISLTSAAPAFAGWSPTPSKATPHQLSAAEASCGQGLGSPVLSESRGPYVAAIYDTGSTDATCLNGDSVNLGTTDYYANAPTVPAGQVQLDSSGQRDTAGNDLTMAEGRIGSGVTAVTIDLSDGSSVQATVSGGWYMAWWPGTATASTAQVTTASGSASESFPAAPALPACPTGGHCTVGYASGGGPGGPNYSGTRSTSSASGFSGNTGGDAGNTGQ